MKTQISRSFSAPVLSVFAVFNSKPFNHSAHAVPLQVSHVKAIMNLKNPSVSHLVWDFSCLFFSAHINRNTHQPACLLQLLSVSRLSVVVPRLAIQGDRPGTLNKAINVRKLVFCSFGKLGCQHVVFYRERFPAGRNPFLSAPSDHHVIVQSSALQGLSYH